MGILLLYIEFINVKNVLFERTIKVFFFSLFLLGKAVLFFFSLTQVTEFEKYVSCMHE